MIDLAYLAFLVSSAMWPEASNPVIVPAVNRLMDRLENACETQGPSYNDSIQFHPAGAPVPLSEMVIS